VLAAAYNRLLQTTHEGGLQVKEYRAIYQADRIRNVSGTWMGATVGCAQCHDHKYDPYTARDFYALGSFFADVDDEKHMGKGGFGGAPNALPTTRLPELPMVGPFDRKRAAALDSEIAVLRASLPPQPDQKPAKKPPVTAAAASRDASATAFLAKPSARPPGLLESWARHHAILPAVVVGKIVRRSGETAAGIAGVRGGADLAIFCRHVDSRRRTSSFFGFNER
jgi:hypothetical protein